ncbi:hypothetical protein T11_2041 [Trichinella zimbabwensis]|uniref:Uncharacterized protein n=1 Tax=Trichinella zimbabwensis TaxID=268475 RepID=A0A0V1HZT7_9BILA|nr:hypothetical protein T11_2041 [Trichinella zimbabwensis]
MTFPNVLFTVHLQSSQILMPLSSLITETISIVHAVCWTGSKTPCSTRRSNSSDMRTLRANGSHRVFTWIDGTDPSILSTTGGPFTVSRVLENNSFLVWFSAEVGITLCIPINRMPNGSNQFLPSRLQC